MWIYRKQNWTVVFFMSVFIACFTLSTQSAPQRASQYPPYDADSAATGVAPAATGVAPAATGVAPAATDAAPAAKDAAPAATGVVPAAKDAAPAATGVAPAATDAAPAATDAVPAATDAVPAATDAAPAATGVAPAATDAAPAATDAAPAATDAVPAATDAVPAATDAVPAATDATPAATDAVPAAKDAVPAATDAVPAAKDAVPAAKDAVPAAKDAVPAAKDAAPAATGVAPAAKDAVPAATDADSAATGADSAALDADFSFQGLIQDREFILENQGSLFKSYDLDKLLHKIRTVLEHNDLESVQKQFHRLFDKESSVVYSCPSDYATLDENFKSAKEEVEQEYLTGDGYNSVADGENHESRESHNLESRFGEINDRPQETSEHLKTVHNAPKEAEGRLEKTHEESNHAKLQHSEDVSLLSAKTPLFSPKTLYKKGYDFILSGNYVEAEKAFCAFQNRYQMDPLSDDALFWLAESLLGQKRYHEAAQVYLNVWYLDKKKHYTSEILLKLAISMVALGYNEEACTVFAKKSTSSKTPKLSKTLECVFCKPLKKERGRSRCSLD